MIIALAAAIFLLGTYCWVCFLFRLSLALPYFLGLWGWPVVLASGGYGLYLTRGWDTTSKLPKVIAIIFLLIAILLGLAWSLLVGYAHMLFSQPW